MASHALLNQELDPAGPSRTGKPYRSATTLSLSDESRDRISNHLAQMDDPYQDIRKAMLDAFLAGPLIDRPVLQALFDYSTRPDSAAALLIDNLPRDLDLPPTPLDGKPIAGRSTHIGEGTLLALARILGEPLGYTTEKEGFIIHNVVPMRGGEHTQSNQGSRGFLMFHNDTMYDRSGFYNRYNPDFLILYCHRADEQGVAETLCANARDIVAHLDPATLAILRQPLFRMAAPSSYSRFIARGKVRYSRRAPVLSGTIEYPEIWLAANGVQPITEEAASALRTLYDLCADPGVSVSVRLRPGQALLVNNRKGVHARTSFEPSYNANERWLLRANIRRDVWSMRERWTGAHNVYD